jgi:hypothetical protein
MWLYDPALGLFAYYRAFNPEKFSGDSGAAVLSTITSCLICILFVASHYRGIVRNKKAGVISLISDEERARSIIMCLFIILVEIVYIHGERMGIALIPWAYAYSWLLTNGIVLFTLAHAQFQHDSFRILIYIPNPIYQCATLYLMVQRIIVDNPYGNYDVLLLLFFNAFSTFCTYRTPKCFVIKQESIKYHKDKTEDYERGRELSNISSASILEEIEMHDT